MLADKILSCSASWGQGSNLPGLSSDTGWKAPESWIIDLICHMQVEHGQGQETALKYHSAFSPLHHLWDSWYLTSQHFCSSHVSTKKQPISSTAARMEWYLFFLKMVTIPKLYSLRARYKTEQIKQCTSQGAQANAPPQAQVVLSPELNPGPQWGPASTQQES